MRPNGLVEFVAKVTGASDVVCGARLRELWGGYGELFRVSLKGASVRTAIVKSVTPPAGALECATVSHERKRRSYDVEQTFYRDFALRCADRCRVPQLIGAQRDGENWLLVLEDLDVAGYDRRNRRCNETDLTHCIEWLAAFHANFLMCEPNGLWPVGTYWHLATRTDELLAIDDAKLRDFAPRLDEMLEACRFQTLVHGDPKEDNFCFGPTGVAGVDFQYVGAGCGMKDLAYLLANGSAEHAGLGEPACLDHYFETFRTALRSTSQPVDADALERQWRALYPIAYADFYRFIAGWAPEHYRADRAAQQRVRAVIDAM